MSLELQRKLKAARSKLNLSQSQFAKQIGVPVRTLQGWEVNQSTPRGIALTAINRILDDILGE